jgi:hypothetical protein
MTRALPAARSPVTSPPGFPQQIGAKRSEMLMNHLTDGNADTKAINKNRPPKGLNASLSCLGSGLAGYLFMAGTRTGLQPLNIRHGLPCPLLGPRRRQGIGCERLPHSSTSRSGPFLLQPRMTCRAYRDAHAGPPAGVRPALAKPPECCAQMPLNWRSSDQIAVDRGFGFLCVPEPWGSLRSPTI